MAGVVEAAVVSVHCSYWAAHMCLYSSERMALCPASQAHSCRLTLGLDETCKL